MRHHLWRMLSVLIVLGVLVTGCDAEVLLPEDVIDEVPPTTEPIARATAAPARPATEPLPAGTEAEWLIMLYQDADDQILEQDILIDLNEAERVGSNEQIRIVSQIDRFRGGYKGMGNWTSTKRFLITQDDDLDTIGSQELADLGEVNMAAADTLTDFITWAVQTYPAKKYALIMSDHGSGWPGGFSDPAPGGTGDDDIFLASAFGVDNLWLMEIDQALEAARQTTGVDKFDLLGFDACLMAQLEVFTMLAKHGRYAVASQEVEPSLGWAYTDFLTQLTAAPQMDGAELSTAIVNSYIRRDQLIVDAQYRRALVEREFGVRGDYSEAEVAEAKSTDVTLSAIDLSAVPDVLTALDQLAVDLSGLDQQVVAEARTYAQSFENVFGDDVPPPYIDLGHFAALASKLSEDAAVTDSARQLFDALQTAVIAEVHGPQRPGATGMVIYFPAAQLYKVNDNLGYDNVADVFTADSNWDEFLSYLYRGGRAPSGAERATRTRVAEIAKPLEIAPLQLSAEVVRPDTSVRIQSEVKGDRLGFVYTFIGRVLPDEQLLLIEDADYVFADNTQEVNGVQYPSWPDGAVALDWEWAPFIFAIHDGTTSIRALAAPEEYDNELPVYSTEVKYVPVDGSPSRRGRLFFRDNALIKVFGFTGTDDTGGLREITPEIGDQFTVIEQGFDLNVDSGDELVERDGGTLTYTGEPFTLETIDAPAGSYYVGFIAEDLDGNQFPTFESLFVENAQTSIVPGFSSFASETLGAAVLYPEQWTAEESADLNLAIFTGDVATTEAAIARLSYPDAASNEEADLQAIEFTNSILGDSQDFELTTDVQPFWLGGYEGREQEFRYTEDGQSFYGGVIAATVDQGTTFAFIFVAREADFEVEAENFGQMADTFDILLSGVSKEQQGAPQPEFGDTVFVDPFDGTADFSLQPDSGDWGTAEYNTDGQFVVGLNAYAGPLYDFYPDVTLPDAFMLQLNAGYEGTADNAYGVIFRVQGLDQFYAFNISGDGYFTVERYDGEESTTLIDWTASSAIVQDELTANSLAVVASESNYQLYINGEQVGEFDDATYSGGSLGIITDNYDEENPVNFYFDEMVVGVLQ